MTPIDRFQRRAAEIEALFAAGEIGPETRRALLERARDSTGVANISGRTVPMAAIPGGGRIAAMNDETYRAMRAEENRRRRAR